MSELIDKIIALSNELGAEVVPTVNGFHISFPPTSTIPIYSPVDFKPLTSTGVPPYPLGATINVDVRGASKYAPVPSQIGTPAPNPPTADPNDMPIPFNGKTVLDQNTAVLDAVDSQDKLVDDLFTVSLPIRVNLASVLAAYPSWDNALVVRKAHPYVIQFRTYNAELGPAFAATTDWIKIG